MQAKKHIAVAVILVAFIGTVSAANHYIRDGANGAGSDWENALDDLPQTLIRGDTYYIADGTYGGHTFNDTEQGEQYIYIKKAIESDHGTDVGWQTSYGDGSADFVFVNASDPNYYRNKERFQFRKGYYILDGQVGGGPGSWDSGHGFRIIAGPNMTSTSYRGMILLREGLSGPWYDTDYIEFRHIEITSPYRAQYDGEAAILANVNSWEGPGGEDDNNQGSHNITISHSYIHDLSVPISTVYAQDWIVEYSYIARNDVESAERNNQGTAWHDYGSDYMTIRYNIFEDIDGTANIDLKKNHNHSNYDWRIYGNVFWNTPGTDIGGTGGNGVIGDAGGAVVPDPNRQTSDMKIYNNAFVNINTNATLNGYNAGIWFGPPESKNNKAYNNIWYNSVSRATYPLFTHVDDHNGNWYYDVFIGGVNRDSTLADDETDGQLGTGDPFVDWQNMDFRLKEPTDSGVYFDWMDNRDMFGNIRGADGNWDRGAIEFQGEAPPECTTDSECQGQICCSQTCVDPTCTTNAECDDLNAATTDECTLPSTCNAACENTPTAKCVDTPALLNYISQWKQGQINMPALMQKIAAWKAGTGC